VTRSRVARRRRITAVVALRTSSFPDLAALPPRSGSRCFFARCRLWRRLSAVAPRLSNHARPPATRARNFVRKEPCSVLLWVRASPTDFCNTLERRAGTTASLRSSPAPEPLSRSRDASPPLSGSVSILRPKLLEVTGYPTTPSEPSHPLRESCPSRAPPPVQGRPWTIGVAWRRVETPRVKGSRERELPSSKALEHSLSPPRRVRGLETPSTDRHDGQRSSSFVAPRRAALPEGPRVLSAVPTPARATGIAPFRPPGLPLVHAASLRHCSREERLCYRPALAPGPDGPSILGGLVRSSACTEVLAHASVRVRRRDRPQRP